MKSKQLAKLPEYAVALAQDTMTDLQGMQAACQRCLKNPALPFEVTLNDANDLAPRRGFWCVPCHQWAMQGRAREACRLAVLWALWGFSDFGRLLPQRHLSLVALVTSVARKINMLCCRPHLARSMKVRRAQSQKDLLASMINAVAKMPGK
jgi:hypothetical protein